MKLPRCTAFIAATLFNAVMLVSVTAYGQSGTFANNVFGNRLAFNPSQAGMSGCWRVDGIFKRALDNSQPGLPKELLVMADGVLSESAGIGAVVYSNNVGLLKESLFDFNYAYGFSVTNNLKLRMGITAGFKSLRVNPDLVNSSTVVGDQGDPTLLAFNSAAPSFYSAFGLTVYSKDLELQLVLPNLTASMQSAAMQTIDYSLAQGALTYTKRFPGDNALKVYAGGMMFKQTGTTFTGGAEFLYHDFISFHSMYASSGSITAGAGITIQKSFQLSLDYSIGGIYSKGIYGGSGVSEIRLGYLFNKSKNQ